jgi:uncharacterized membrane protein
LFKVCRRKGNLNFATLLQDGYLCRLMKLQINWSALGVSAAVACAIHCALLPLFISTLPLFGINLLDNIYFEAGMILVALLIGGLTLLHGYRKHHHRLAPLFYFILGMGLLIINHFLPSKPILLVILSSGLIIIAYYLNWKYCRQAKHCHSSDCNH